MAPLPLSQSTKPTSKSSSNKLHTFHKPHKPDKLHKPHKPDKLHKPHKSHKRHKPRLLTMAACTVALSSSLQQIGAASASAERNGVKQVMREARFVSSARIVVPSVRSTTKLRPVVSRRPEVRAQAGEGSLQPKGGSLEQSDGEGVSLGTALIPPDVDLKRLESLLFQWGNSLTANANLPLPTALKVDKVKGGVRLGYIRLNEGVIEDLVYIDVIVYAATGDQKAHFQATRNGRYKNQVPPGEPLIMQSLLQALRKSIQLARE